MRYKKSLLGMTLALSLIANGTLANADYSTYQKTLSSYQGNVTTLSAKQSSEILAALKANPSAEKFICTGIRLKGSSNAENVKARARAKQACALALQIRPNLSTWYQTKETSARSYAGKVLLTVKTATGPSDSSETAANSLSIISTSAQLENPEACKLYSTDESAFHFISNGNKGVYKSTGTQKHYLAIVRFDDFPPGNDLSTSDFVKRYLSDLPEFYKRNSNGRLAISFDYNKTVVSLGKTSAEVPWLNGTRTYEAHLSAIKLALGALDEQVDFSQYDGVHVYFWTDPTKVTGGTAAWNSAAGPELVLDGKRFPSSSTYTTRALLDWGSDGPRVFSHEFGHTLGLQDLYAYQNDPADYSTEHRFVGMVDLMGYVHAATPSFFSWNKWRLQWLDNTDVYCMNSIPTEAIALGRMDKQDIPSLAVFNTSSTARVVAEYRPAGSDGLSYGGVIFYRVDRSANGMGSMQVSRVSASSLTWSSADYVKNGESRCIDSVCISVKRENQSFAEVEFSTK